MSKGVIKCGALTATAHPLYRGERAWILTTVHDGTLDRYEEIDGVEINSAPVGVLYWNKWAGEWFLEVERGERMAFSHSDITSLGEIMSELKEGKMRERTKNE